MGSGPCGGEASVRSGAPNCGRRRASGSGLREFYGAFTAPCRSRKCPSDGVSRAGHDRGRRRRRRPVAARREGARDPGAAAARPRPHGAHRRAARRRLGGRAARAGRALARGPRGEPARVPRARPRPRRPVLAARPRRPRLPARDPAGAARLAPLRALRRTPRPGCPRRPRWSCSTAAWRYGAGRRSAISPTPSSRATEVRRLEDLHSQAEEARARALVELGRPLEAVAELRRLAAADPLREELIGTLMVALYAAGRQVEALEAYRELAARLREIGLAPGTATRVLERRILDNDATLAAPAAPPATGSGAAVPSGREPELARLRAALARALAGRPRRRARVRASRASARRRSSTRSCTRRPRPAAWSPASASASRSAAPASRTCRCWRRSARSRAGPPARPSSPRCRAMRRPGSSSCRGCSAREAEAVRMRAQGSTRARMLREMLEAVDAVCAVDAARARARGPALGRRLHARPRRRPAAPARAGAAAAARHVPPRRRRRRSSSWRTSWCVRGLCEELHVGRLAPAAVAAHLALRFPSAPLPDGLAEALARRSGGNPLFMRNLLDHWLADGTLAERAGRGRADAAARGARGRRAADAARAHPRPARPAAEPRTPSCSPPRASRGATSRPTRSPPRSSAIATRSRPAARSWPGARA